MANYIDRDRFFLQKMQESRVSDTEWQNGFWDGVDDTLADMQEFESVDAVPVVRCKDCKNLMFSDCYGECSVGNMGIVGPKDFCSRGERKTK